MNGVAERWVDRNTGRLILVLVIGTCLSFAGLGYLQTRVTQQASAGQQARERQCQVMPVSIKQERWFLRRHVISFSDFHQYMRGAPTRSECIRLQGK